MELPHVMAAASSTDWAQSVLLFIGAGITLGGLIAGFYGARQKGIIELLKTENDAYKDSNERLHQENSDLKQRCATSEAEAKIYRDNMTQRPSIEKLIATSTQQHGEYMLEMGKMTKQLGKLTAAVTTLTRKEGRDA